MSVLFPMSRSSLIALSIRLALALVIVATSIGVYAVLVATGPEPRSRPAQPVVPTVEVATLEPASYQVQIPSRGLIQPKVRSLVTAEVSGKIVEVSPSLLAGARFAKGDLLVQLDERDYQNALQRAQTAVVRAETALALAEAQTERARADWERLGNGQPPSDLTLRIPQLNEARAALLAAQTDEREARINLERCRVTAPFKGQVVSKQVDVGQFVSPGSALAEVFATDAYEVRLPVRPGQLPFLESEGESAIGSAVELTSETGGDLWQARIVRTEAEIDAATRQVFLIAEISTEALENAFIPVGAYVEARIEGSRFEDVLLIPRTSVRGRSTVLKVSPENTLELIEARPIYRGDPDFLVASPTPDLAPGDRISLTPLPFAGQGTPVRPQDPAPPSDRETGPRPLANGGTPRKPAT